MGYVNGDANGDALVKDISNLNLGNNGRIEKSFARCKQQGKAALLTFVTAGYPTSLDTVPVLLAMEEGGATLIEVGVPYTDPQADGATIQRTNEIAISGGVASLEQCLDLVSEAREKGLSIPVVLMGYYNPFYQYGIERLCSESKEKGVDGFIVVDLPPEEGVEFLKACSSQKLSNIPLVAPTTSDERIQSLSEQATSFIYCVSRTGVTGARDALPDDLSEFIQRVRSKTQLPLCVGFGISNAGMV